jgi:hypothetical protein
MNLLHMITSVPDRSPSFTMFGNPDYFNQVASASQGRGTSCTVAPSCVVEAPAFAWNHGDVQRDIVTTWFGMVGPGVKKLGRVDNVFSDHADLRPTILVLLGLVDDYVHDGRVLAEFLQGEFVQSRDPYIDLSKVYKQINAPVARLGLSALVYANKSVTGADSDYNTYLATIPGITSQRNALASKMIALLNGAAFANKSINDQQADQLARDGKELIATVQRLAGCNSGERHDDSPLFQFGCKKTEEPDEAPK